MNNKIVEPMASLWLLKMKNINWKSVDVNVFAFILIYIPNGKW